MEQAKKDNWEHKEREGVDQAKRKEILSGLAKVERGAIERGAAAIYEEKEGSMSKLARAERAIDKLTDADFNNKVKYTDFMVPLKEAIQLCKKLSMEKVKTEFSNYYKYLSLLQTLEQGLESFANKALGIKEEKFDSMDSLKEEFKNQMEVAKEISALVREDMMPDEELVKTS